MIDATTTTLKLPHPEPTGTSLYLTGAGAGAAHTHWQPTCLHPARDKGHAGVANGHWRRATPLCLPVHNLDTAHLSSIHVMVRSMIRCLSLISARRHYYHIFADHDLQNDCPRLFDFRCLRTEHPRLLLHDGNHALPCCPGLVCTASSRTRPLRAETPCRRSGVVSVVAQREHSRSRIRSVLAVQNDVVRRRWLALGLAAAASN